MSKRVDELMRNGKQIAQINTDLRRFLWWTGGGWIGRLGAYRTQISRRRTLNDY